MSIAVRRPQPEAPQDGSAQDARPAGRRPAAPRSGTRARALRRIGQAALVVAATFVLAFLLLHALPGDAIVARYASPELGLSPEQLADLRAAYGADQPVWVQLGLSAWGFLTGDLGTSLQTGAEVSSAADLTLPSPEAVADFLTEGLQRF